MVKLNLECALRNNLDKIFLNNTINNVQNHV